MDFRIRDAVPADWPAIPGLNDPEIPHVNAMTDDMLAHFGRAADYFRVAERGGEIAGFLIALGPAADYQSPNFRWFQRRYERFAYVDRIVVARSAQGRGIGRAFYADLEQYAHATAPILACEVNLRPSNDRSMRFHRRFGFAQVGAQETEGGTKEVALMIKRIAGEDEND